MSLAAKKAKAGGAPRWMVTFADLMALLFALFVLLLSFSEVNMDSFKKNAGPISEAFNSAVIKRDEVIVSIPKQIAEQDVQEQIYQQKAFREDLWVKLKDELVQELRAGVLTMEKTDRGVVMTFPDDTTFVPGGADLKEEILPVIDKVTHVLTRVDGDILVSGHTDNIPLSNQQYRSNWDLSSARAVSVVHQMLYWRELDPSRITAQGMAESRPVTSNDTAESRARNRRVEIAIELPPIYVDDARRPVVKQLDQ